MVLCAYINGTLEVCVLVSATKTYCLTSSGKVPSCIEMTEDLKSTSKLKLTVISCLAFLSAHC